MKMIKKDWYLPVLILSVFLLGCFLYPKMPAKIPSHWTGNWTVDSYGSKLSGIVFLPLVGLAAYLVLKIVPYISASKSEDDETDNIFAFFHVLNVIVVYVILCLHLVTLLAGTGVKINFWYDFSIALTILLAVLGSCLQLFKDERFEQLEIVFPWLKKPRTKQLSFTISGIFLIILSIISLAYIYFSGRHLLAFPLLLSLSGSVICIIVSYLISKIKITEFSNK